MADDELLRKIDRTLEPRLDREERRDDEFRQFLQAFTERLVPITQELIETITAGFAQLQAEIACPRPQDPGEHRGALLKVLDRLGPSPEQG